MAATQMGCLNTEEIERAFRDALKRATRLTMAGDRLQLLDVTGKRVAAFIARAQTSPPSIAPELLDRAHRLQSRTWDLEVERHESDPVRSTGPDARQMSGQVPARSNCEAVELHPVVHDQGRSCLPLADGRRRDLPVRTTQEEQAIGPACEAEGIGNTLGDFRQVRHDPVPQARQPAGSNIREALL